MKRGTFVHETYSLDYSKQVNVDPNPNHILILLIILKPKSISVSDPSELIFNNSPEQLARSRLARFQKSSYPHINIVDVTIIELFQLRKYL